jgi:hypothetical protein
VEIFSGKFFVQQNFKRAEKILSSAECITVARVVQIHDDANPLFLGQIATEVFSAVLEADMGRENPATRTLAVLLPTLSLIRNDRLPASFLS